ncbi:hypothetical protein M758_12G096700 [Ceratodon purpureus]|nr:hypothetical protein M758_12G096700 [Ceratodon purpureus]
MLCSFEVVVAWTNFRDEEMQASSIADKICSIRSGRI